MSCLEVRGLLAEFALGILPQDQARTVERHLHWCRGCRRELEDLEDGAAAVALSLPPVQPPPGLEERVVRRVLAASGARPSSHRGPRLLLAATLAALTLAFGALGWAVAERREADDVRRQAEQVERQLRNLRGLVELSRGLGATPFEVTLSSPRGEGGSFGAAVIYSSPRTDDFVLVSAFLADERGGPFTASVQDASGRVLSGGPLVKTANGDWLFRDQPRRNLSRATLVVVKDRAGRVLLMGRVVPASPTPPP